MNTFIHEINKIKYLLTCIVFVSACESKYVEKAPDQVEMKGPTVSERGEQKALIDLQINKIQIVLAKISSLITTINSFDNSKDPDSFVDIANESLKELKEGMPEYNPKKSFVRYALVDSLETHLQNNCTQWPVALSTYPLEKLTPKGKYKVADRLGIFYSLCNKDDYKPILFVDLYRDDFKIKFISKNLAFLDIEQYYSNVPTNPECTVHFDSGPNNKIKKIYCVNLPFKKGAETILIKTLNFLDNDSLIFAELDFYNVKGSKYKSMTFSKDKNGDLYVKPL